MAQLATLSPVNAYSIQTITDSTPSVYSSLQTYKRVGNNVKQEFINVKSEYDIDVSEESSEDPITPSTGPKRSLPHKKRIARKLKQQGKKNMTERDSAKSNRDAAEIDQGLGQSFKCELCSNMFSGQLKFFEHLKVS